jgi:beta-N-acetylhexosaminidase
MAKAKSWTRLGGALPVALCLLVLAGAGEAEAAPVVKRSSSAELQARRWLSRMSLAQQAAQLMMVPCYGEPLPRRAAEYRKLEQAIRRLQVGGLIVINRVRHGSVRQAEPYGMAAFLNRMQRLARVPLLVAADFERGASMRVANTAKYPHLMAYGAADDVALTRQLGKHTAREARALGVHWVFAPVSDVNTNPDNPIINIRAFGEDPALVARHVKAFIEGTRADAEKSVLVTAKHFPGHGDTTMDSHLGLAKVDASRDRLQAQELTPFRAAIEAGVDAVMTAHLAVPALEPEEIPITVSTRVVHDLLRQQLHFNGLVVTDAMDMQGVARQFSPGEAAVRALEAGADVILMPPDPEGAVRAVVEAVRKGRLTPARLRESALRVLRAKARLGLARSRTTPVEDLAEELDVEEALVHAREVAERALTLVRHDQKTVPIQEGAGTCIYVLVEGRYTQQGRSLLAEVEKRAPQVKTFLLDPQASQAEIDAVTNDSSCSRFIVVPFVSVAAYRGNVSLAGNHGLVMERLVFKGKPLAIAAMGSPYILRHHAQAGTMIATFSTVETSEVALARALFGEIDFSGRLPVSIPGIASLGYGLRLSQAFLRAAAWQLPLQ